MYIENLTSEKFNENLKSINTVIIPIGATEAHGMHLPLGTDVFSPRLFLRLIDEKIGDKVFIAPEIPYGDCLDMSSYPGTVTMPSEVLAQYVYHVAKSFHSFGIKKVIFFNGHGGNCTALNLASEKLVNLSMDSYTLNWWLDFSKDILKITETQGHGGEDETAAVLYYNASLVDMEKACKNEIKPRFKMHFAERGKTVYKGALSGDATLATYEKGERIFKELTPLMVERIEEIINGNYFK